MLNEDEECLRIRLRLIGVGGACGDLPLNLVVEFKPSGIIQACTVS